MARNRKRGTSELRFGPALKAFALCLLLGGSGVGFVLQKNKIYELGRQIKAREVQLDRLKWENNIRASQLADLHLPQKLSERVQAMRLGLALPKPGQIVWLPDPVERSSASNAPGLLVLRKPR